ncbi:flagellar hook-length control protein FliK, partial [Nocardioides massiliensis]
APTGEPTSAAPAPAGIALPALNAAATPGAAPVEAGPATNGSVADQVSRVLDAEVARVVQRGDGTHRISLTLHPASLGQVQVTLTVRAGALTVTLAAGPEAQAALGADGAELHRLLGRAVSGPTEIVVQQLPGSPSSAQPEPTASGGSTADDAGQGRGRAEADTPDHHHARTRGGTPPSTEHARDGDSREHPTAGAPSIRSGTRPLTGVDVRV